MCDHCLPFSRRTLLKSSAAATAAAALAACQPTPSTNLPDPIDDNHFITEYPGPPLHIDPKTLQLPPPAPAQPTEYGDIIPRTAWSHLPLQLAHANPMGGVQRITLHHSGDGKPFLDNSFADTARHLQIVQQAHLQRGMIDIAYHFAVDRAGRAWQLRWLSYEGQHVRIGHGIHWNEHNVGIVALGDFNIQSPTTAQCNRLFALTRLVQQKYQVPNANIKMHGELVSTDCPGKHLAPYIKSARAHNQL